ncbi:MAG: Glucoamylase (glucan-1,4-alpha-glucosidase), GH15 family [Chloroflexi bacterium]|jgi:GH15 family glucan-1,4-alpha-glucosidase|nr:MAG: Glucoamylase (glucan-1,4-alpha-glucosidase), GH15 family [Chloroflexota bacterium]
MTYQPIENYGVIGDMHTVALVGMNGSIDWYCYPRFDSPSIFASILDHDKGGHFQIVASCDGVTEKQIYWPETNVLVTRFLSPYGVAEVIDFMPVSNGDTENHSPRIIRQVTTVRGSMPFHMECFPAFDYARSPHKTTLYEGGAVFQSEDLSLRLSSTIPLATKSSGVVCDFIMEEGQTATFTLDHLEIDSNKASESTLEEANRLFKATVTYWERWISRCTYTGRWREMVHRSALMLKLLTYEPTGAIVAAPTCSLPEDPGGERNWDYRYTWVRDAAFTLYALLRIGFTDEAAAFMKWIEARCCELNPDGSLQIMYSIDGTHELKEETLDHLEGYRGAKPVRVGNGAYNQLQLDIYGELMDAVYLYNKYGAPISYDFWNHLRRLTNWVCDNWKRPDEGVWEVRGGPRQFVYSKVMCWVAVDRALRLADKRSFPADRVRWLAVRDEIFEDIMENGYNVDRGAFVQSYGSDSLDAANLIMPLVFMISPTDPRMLSTLEAINRSPEAGGLVSNSLVYRYNVKRSPDGLAGDDSTFNICTFWLVEALTRAGRFDDDRLDEARLIFEKMLGYANHLGLYAEETGHSGEALGNFPQAFTHLALISAAFNLDRALGSSR